jgi:Flp pilus assembly pilin Flp
MQIIRCFTRDERGAAAIEFAFVAPMFLLLLLVIAELGLTLATQSVLDGATRGRGAADPHRANPVPDEPDYHIPDSAVLRNELADDGREL